MNGAVKASVLFATLSPICPSFHILALTRFFVRRRTVQYDDDDKFFIFLSSSSPSRRIKKN